jgi:TonB-linked SusC/RagA family outer membrane protein
MKRITLFVLCMGLFLNSIWAQDRTITGRITDNTGAPLAGVTITVAGTKIKTSTKEDGSFTIAVPATARSIELSYVGFVTQTVPISGNSSLNISMQPATAELTGVVVTGYGNVEKSKYTGAASKVSEKAIRNIPMASFDQILQGRAPGLTVLSESGQPGSAANVILRGPTSINGGSTPLYIVDGVPVEAGAFQGINANDIASIDVLKDASAAALYGSRGAAGVIVVTTKRGKSGKMRLGYSGQYGVKFAPEFGYEVMSTDQLLKSQEALGTQIPNSTLSTWGNFPTLPGWQYSQNNPNKLVGGVIVPKTSADYAFGAQQLDSLRAIHTDWYSQFFETANFSNNEISLSGGEGRTRIYSSLGLYQEEGINKGTDMNRVSLRNNIDHRDQKLTFAFSSNLSYTRRNLQMNPLNGFNAFINPFGVAQLTPQYITPTLPNGKYNVGADFAFFAPTSLDKRARDKVYNNQIKGVISATANYDFTKNIYAGLLAGVDFRETNNITYNDPRVYNTFTSTNVRARSGSMSEAFTRFFQPTGRAYLGYKTTFNAEHSIDATVYGEIIKTYNKAVTATGYGVDTLRPNTINAVTPGNATNQLYQVVGGSKSQRTIESVFGNLKYSFRQKYALTATYRYDAVSFLPVANRAEDFYSIGAVWDVAKESFLDRINAINSLRLKLSWGQSANAENFPFGDFGFLPQYNTNAGLVSGVTGITIAIDPTSGNPQVGNPDAAWEFTNTTNLGMDFSLFSNRLYGDVQLYKKVTKNLFATLSLSAASGFGQQDINAGSMYNKGIEYNLNYDIVNNRNVTWTVSANGAYNQNKVTSLGNATSFEVGTELISVGLPLGSHYEVRWAGVDAATGAPLYYTKEGKITTNYSTDDKVQTHGTWIPPVTGGFGSSLRYKNFDFSVFFNYASNTTRVNNMEFFMQNPGFLQQGLNQDAGYTFWTKPGDIANVQSPLYQNNFSSRLIQDASWVRLRNITASYTLPESVIRRAKFLSNARFYVTGQNLLTWTHWRGLDPEDSNNISSTEYPNPRAITAGIEVNF